MLRAESWDQVAESLVAETGAWRVHSLFERALNLVSDEGALLGLVGPSAGNGPATIVLTALPAEGLDRIALAVGLPARAALGGLEVGGRLRIDLSGVRRWVPARTPVAIGPREIRRRLARAEQLAGAVAPSAGLAPLLPHLATLAEPGEVPPAPSELDTLNQTAWTGLQALLPPWRIGDTPTVQQAATGLIGLGPGLTPSGDDLLAGLLIGTARAGGTDVARLGRACLAAATGRTTDVALARLGHAARNTVEEVQETVLTSLLGTDDAALDAAVARAARWGHTSGVDTLVGLFLGLRLGLT